MINTKNKQIKILLLPNRYFFELKEKKPQLQLQIIIPGEIISEAITSLVFMEPLTYLHSP